MKLVHIIILYIPSAILWTSFIKLQKITQPLRCSRSMLGDGSVLISILFIWYRSTWFEITGSWMKLNLVNNLGRQLECRQFCNRNTVNWTISVKFSELPVVNCIVSFSYSIQSSQVACKFLDQSIKAILSGLFFGKGEQSWQSLKVMFTRKEVLW